jgi:hypothetical protein
MLFEYVYTLGFPLTHFSAATLRLLLDERQFTADSAVCFARKMSECVSHSI